MHAGRMYLVKAGQWLEVVVLAEVQHQCEQAEDLSVEAELQEEPVVVLSHAVVDPGGDGTTTFRTHTLQKKTFEKNLGSFARSALGLQLAHQGQWWSILRTQWPHRLQWWERLGRMRLHLLHSSQCCRSAAGRQQQSVRTRAAQEETLTWLIELALPVSTPD